MTTLKYATQVFVILSVWLAPGSHARAEPESSAKPMTSTADVSTTDASTTDAKLGWLTAEVNPFFFATDGYFIKMAVAPEHSKWNIAAIALRSKLSRKLADLSNSKNEGRGFGDEEYRSGSVGIDLGRFIGGSAASNSIHASLALNVFRVRVHKDGDSGDFTTFAPAVRVGYRWYPGGGKTFFLEPAMAVGTQIKLGGDSVIGGTSYRFGGLLKASGVHLGIRI